MAANNAPHASSEVEHVVRDKPEDWGWHHEFKAGRQIGGWASFLVLLALLTTTHYNDAGSLAIILAMLTLAGGLLWDFRRRKHQWRS